VVTREGRVANYEVLSRNRSAQGVDVTRLLDKVSRSRFTPAERGVARAPVAVNMVWLLARTTVKGTPRALDFERITVTPAPAVAAPIAPPVKPQPGTIEEQMFEVRVKGCRSSLA
jgi:hypothetical protein